MRKAWKARARGVARHVSVELNDSVNVMIPFSEERRSGLHSPGTATLGMVRLFQRYAPWGLGGKKKGGQPLGPLQRGSVEPWTWREQYEAPSSPRPPPFASSVTRTCCAHAEVYRRSHMWPPVYFRPSTCARRTRRYGRRVGQRDGWACVRLNYVTRPDGCKSCCAHVQVSAPTGAEFLKKMW